MPSTPPPPALPLTGRCMCGAVRLEIAEPLLGALSCHCRRCQRRTGTAFSVSGRVKPGSFLITRGEEHVRSWRPADGGWVKSFCAPCGGQTHTADPDRPERKAVRRGTLDGDPGIRPGAHQFVAYAAPWEPLPDDGLPRFSERLSGRDPS